MRVSAEQLEECTAKVAAQQTAAYLFVQGALRSFWELNGGALSWEDMAAFAEQVFVTCSEQFGAQAAGAACEAYDGAMAELGLPVQPAQPVQPVSQHGAAKAVSTAAKASGGDVPKFVEALSVKAHGSVGRSANTTTIANAERDYSKGVRYARVPTGKETCGFCLMLASRGFDYKSKQSAGWTGGAFNRFHDRCDCRVVAGDASTTVDGYDPEWLYDAYMDARKTVNPEGIRKEMAGADSDAVNKRITDSICNEIEKRSRGWSWDGIVAETPKSEYFKFTDALAQHGLSTSITDREGAPLRMNGLTWGMDDSTGGGSVADSISVLRQERRDGGTKTDGHYVLLVDGIADAERAAKEALNAGETAILIDPNVKDKDTGMTPMRRIER